MNHSEWRLVFGSLLAVAVPATILHFSTEASRLDVGLTAPPFGWPRLLVAHLATALPLAWLVAFRLGEVPSIGRIPAVAWFSLGLLGIGAAWWVGPVARDVVVGLDFDAVWALLIRSMLALCLVMPWCLGAWRFGFAERPPRFGLLLGLAVIAATVPCGLYAQSMMISHTEQVRELVGRERLARAELLLDGLLELASERTVAEKTPRQLARELALTVSDLRRSGERELPRGASTAARLNRAVLMIRLERLAEASELLESIAPRTTLISLLLATVYRDTDRLSESTQLFEQVWDESLPRAANDPEAKTSCMTAVEGLIFNYRELRQPADAERVLNRGLEMLPAEAAWFHFQLGRHYADGGRPQPAMTHLRRAGELDPKRFAADADRIVGQLRTQTPGCFLPRN